MTKFTPPAKLSYGALALLDWLCGKGADGRMVAVSHTGTGSLSCLMEAEAAAKHGLARHFPFSDPALLDRLGGRDVTDLRALDGYGLDHFQRSSFETSARRSVPEIPPERLAAVLERHGREAFGYTDNVYLPSARTIEIWEREARAEASRRREERSGREAATRRLVVIRAPWSVTVELPQETGARLPKDFRFPFRLPRITRPFALAEVRRETAGRLYLSTVERLPAPGGSFLSDPVSGRQPNVYVERSDVMVDGVTREQALRLADVFREDAESRLHARGQLIDRIGDALGEWHLRQVQKDAERDDLVAEILGTDPDAGPRP